MSRIPLNLNDTDSVCLETMLKLNKALVEGAT